MRKIGTLLAGMALVLAAGCGPGVPVIEVYEDGTVTLDGDPIEAADLAALAGRPEDSPPVRLKIHDETPAQHVWDLQTRLQESGVTRVVVVTE